jgi:hypothetical protein
MPCSRNCADRSGRRVRHSGARHLTLAVSELDVDIGQRGWARSRARPPDRWGCWLIRAVLAVDPDRRRTFRCRQDRSRRGDRAEAARRVGQRRGVLTGLCERGACSVCGMQKCASRPPCGRRARFSIRGMKKRAQHRGDARACAVLHGTRRRTVDCGDERWAGELAPAWGPRQPGRFGVCRHLPCR